MSQMIYGTSTLENGMPLNTDERQLGRRARPAASAARTRCRAPATASARPRSRRARRCSSSPRRSSACRSASLTVSKGVVSGGGKSVTYGELVGGKLFNVNLTTTSLQHGVVAGQAGEPVQARRHDGAARRHPGEGPRHVHLHPQHPRARACCTAAGSARGQGPWLTDGFAKPLSVDASSIKHLPNVKVVQQGRLPRRRRPGRVRGRPGRGAAQGELGRVADPAGPREPAGRASARRTRPGRCRRASRATSGNFDTAFKSAAKTRLGVVHVRRTTATTRSARPAPSPTTRHNGGPDKDTVTVFCNTQNVASTVAGRPGRRSGSTRPNQVRVIYLRGLELATATATTTSTSPSRPR